jgi:cytidyltransferase-like protein
MSKKAFVSGCFDLLHSGHVAFFQEAAQYGELYVAIGSDRNVFQLKNRPTINTQAERLYMIQALTCVHAAFVAKGSGILDFVEELKEIKPDYFVVNEDGSTPAKKKLCEELGIEYIILKRVPHPGLDARSTTALRGFSTIPLALELVQPFLPQPGLGLVLSIHPTPELSSSIRAAALELWGARLPADNPEKLAKILLGYCNLPGTPGIPNPQQAIGITFPGLTRADYTRGYWPAQITSMQDEKVLNFLENCLYLIPLNQSTDEMPKLEAAPIFPAAARFQAESASACWDAMLAGDVIALGASLRESFDAQMALCSPSLAKSTLEALESYRERVLGWQISGETLVLVSDQPIENAACISIRRASD